jgi:hypothetical protein
LVSVAAGVAVLSHAPMIWPGATLAGSGHVMVLTEFTPLERFVNTSQPVVSAGALPTF